MRLFCQRKAKRQQNPLDKATLETPDPGVTNLHGLSTDHPHQVVRLVQAFVCIHRMEGNESASMSAALQAFKLL